MAARRHHRDRRPGDAELGGDLGLAEPVDEDEPGDLALALRQVDEEVAEERREGGEERVRGRVARPDREPLPAAPRLDEEVARRREEGRLVGGGGPDDDRPAEEDGVRLERGGEIAAERIAVTRDRRRRLDAGPRPCPLGLDRDGDCRRAARPRSSVDRSSSVRGGPMLADFG
mgnify:CR=1 FL=1